MTLPSTPLRMFVRLGPDHHRDPALLEGTLAELSAHRDACDEVWLCTEAGFPTRGVHFDSAALMAEAAERFRSLGIEAGMQVGNTIGHGGSLAFSSPALTWQLFTGPDGCESPGCSCPRAPELHRYLSAVLAPYATWQPAACWVDDDLRINQHPPAVTGCFCDRCVATFADTIGEKLSRDQIVSLLSARGGEAIREAWIDFTRTSLAGIARTCARAVRSQAPQCLMGLQQIRHDTGLDNGPDWAHLFAALGEDGLYPVGSRCGDGYYTDYRPREVFVKALGIARQIHRLPANVHTICPEIEGFPHVMFGKSAHGMGLEATLALAFGCDTLSFAINSVTNEPPSFEGFLLQRLAAWRPFWERYRECSADTKTWGLDTLLPRRFGLRPLRDDEPPFAWTTVNLAPLAHLLPLGVPLCPDAPQAPAALVTSEILLGLGDAELEGLLARHILIDGYGLEYLAQRQFAPAIGVDSVPLQESPTAERATDDVVNGSYAGRKWRSFTAPPTSALLPLSAGARSLARFISHDDRDLGASIVTTTTTQGGRWAIIAQDPWRPDVNTARRHQIVTACEWCCGSFPVRIETEAPIVQVPRLDAAGRPRTILLLNAGFDEVRLLRVSIAHEEIPMQLRLLSLAGEISLAATVSEGRLQIECPVLPSWSAAVIVLD